MGYLGGYYDKEGGKVYILKCYPLREETQTPKSVTAETMDIFEVSNRIDSEYCIINGVKKKLSLLGWYHSHPDFENYPSNQDLFTHSHQKQNSLNNDDIESPFVGLILQTWSSFSQETEYRWFNTLRDEAGNYLSMQFSWNIEKNVNINDPSLIKQIKSLVTRYSEDKYKRVRSNLGKHWKTLEIYPSYSNSPCQGNDDGSDNNGTNGEKNKENNNVDDDKANANKDGVQENEKEKKVENNGGKEKEKEKTKMKQSEKDDSSEEEDIDIEIDNNKKKNDNEKEKEQHKEKEKEKESR